MKLHKFCRLILLITATLLVTGCALKPRQQSRFHSAADGGCSCYSCQHCDSYDESGNGVVSYDNQDSAGTFEASPVETVESNRPSVIPDRPLYGSSEIKEPVVSEEQFPQTPTLNAFTDSAVINEVQPDESGPDLESLDEKSEFSSLSGGSFKPAEPQKLEATSETIEPPETIEEPASEVIPEPPKDEAPAEVLKPAEVPEPPKVPEPVQIPEPVAEPQPDEVPEPVAIPEPAAAPKNTFKPGEAFKPRKPRKSLDSSEWNGPSSSDLLLPAIQDTSVPMPEMSNNQTNDSIDSFFGRGSVTPQPKPLRQAGANSKVVLRANPVERNVVYLPPSKSISQVVVPALQSSFKKRAADNALRGFAHTSQPAIEAAASIVANEVIATPTQQSTETARVETQVPPAAPGNVAETQPQTIPVRLRAIPMDEKMIKGSQVKVRFMTHEPAQQVNKQWHLEKFPAKKIPRPIPAPQVETLQPQLQLEIAEPAPAHSSHEHTANTNNSSEVVTPPWRIK